MKNKKVFIALAVLLILSCSLAFADENLFSNAAGFYGMVWPESGVGGLQYQHWFKHLGMQFTAGGWAQSYSGQISSVDCALTAELQGKLYSHFFSPKFGSIFYAWALAGFHGYTDNQDGDLIFYPNGAVGFGLGIELIFIQHISIPVQFGYSGEFPHNMNFGFSFGSGLRYRF